MAGALSSFLGAAQALYHGASERVAPIVGGGAGLAARGAEVARETVRSAVDRSLTFLRPSDQKPEPVEKTPKPITPTDQLKSFLATKSPDLAEEELEDFLSESMDELQKDVAHYAPLFSSRPDVTLLPALPDFTKWGQGAQEAITNALEKNIEDNVKNLSDNAVHITAVFKMIEYFKKAMSRIKKKADKLPDTEKATLDQSLEKLRTDLREKREHIRKKILSYLGAKIHFLLGETEWPTLPEPERPSPITGKPIAFSQAISQEISLLGSMLPILSEEEKAKMTTHLANISEKVAPNVAIYPSDMMTASIHSLESL